MLRFSKTKAFRILAAVAALAAVYAIAGFVVAPRVVRSLLLANLTTRSGVTPTIGEIHVNPFLLQLSVDGFSLTEAGGEKVLGCEHLFVDFELSSVWRRAYSFANIEIGSPYVRASVSQGGSLNLLQLLPESAPRSTAPQQRTPLPAIRIGSFKVSRGLLTYEDRSRPDVFTARLEPIDFELREFTTGAAGGNFTFSGSSKLGERIEWHGHLSVQPIESDGEFQLHGLLAHTVWEYFQDQLNFAVDTGSLDLAATYKFSLKDAATRGSGTPNGGAANAQVDVSRAVLSDLTIRPKDAQTAWITVPRLAVAGAAVDVAKHRAQADLVSLTGLKLVTWFEAGTVNLMKLVAAPSPSSATTVPSTAGTAAAVSLPPWTFDLREFDVRDASIAAEDRTRTPAVKVALAPFSLRVSGVSQDLARPLNVTLDTRVNDKGSLAVTGEVTPQPATADLNLEFTGIDLTAIQPYIAQHTAMTLLGGSLGGTARVHYGAQKNLAPVQFTGDLRVDELHTVDNALHDDFIDWDRLDILGVRYGGAPARLEVEQIVASKPYARVIVESDESMNVKRVLAVRASPDTVVAPATKTMPVSIKKILVRSGRLNFADLSVLPNFSAGIRDLDGTVLGVSSRPSSRAKVNLHGSVHAFSPVSITGEVNVLGPLYTDLAMSFRNIALAVFNPYSGKFAGYDITKGKLTTELHYKIDGRKLDAQHHIVIEQLEFGKRTPSKDAVSLPIKLAVSLLKDRNGVIDLNIPVSGSLDDPEFRLAPVIWKVLVNVLEKAVSAPFDWLGSLFGAGPDIQFIDFRPGASALDASAAEKVKTVAKALTERPQLKIDVPIAVVPALDRPALAAAQFDAQLASAQAAQGAAPGQLALLTQMYTRKFGGEPKFPQAFSELKSKPDTTAAKIAFLKNAIREAIVVGDVELRTLGQQRALALRQVLLSDSQIAPERVFLVANDKATANDGVVRLELSLE